MVDKTSPEKARRYRGVKKPKVQGLEEGVI